MASMESAERPLFLEEIGEKERERMTKKQELKRWKDMAKRKRNRNRTTLVQALIEEEQG